MNRGVKRIFKRAHLMGALLFMLLLAVAWGSPAQGAGPVTYEPGQVVIKLKGGVSIFSINLAYGTNVVSSLLGNTFLLKLPAGTTVEQALQQMSQDARLAYAEPNYLFTTPEDASTNRIYAWGGTDSNGWKRDNDSRSGEANAFSRGYGIIVAILDTGVQLDHPELEDSIDILAYDFVDGDPNPWDDPNGRDDDGDGVVDEAVGHGTHVAGIIHGMAPDALLMPIRVLNSDGRGNNFRTAKAMLYAAASGAEVINMSLGTDQPSQLMTDVLHEIAAQDVVVVAAAGNLNNQTKQYPAADACAIGVTSVDAQAHKSAFASYGDWVDIAAPGENIYSTFPVDGFAWGSGTSMATPYVTAQTVLLRSLNYDLTLDQIGSLIGGSATPLEQGNPHYQGLLGAGQADALRSLTYLTSGTPVAPESNLFAGCNP